MILPAYHICKVVLDDPHTISHAPCYFHWSVNQSYFQVLTFTIWGAALVNPSLHRPPSTWNQRLLCFITNFWFSSLIKPVEVFLLEAKKSQDQAFLFFLLFQQINNILNQATVKTWISRTAVLFPNCYTQILGVGIHSTLETLLWSHRDYTGSCISLRL